MLGFMKSITPADAKVSVQLRLPLPLRNRLVTRATQRDISLNQLCVELLAQGVPCVDHGLDDDKLDQLVDNLIEHGPGEHDYGPQFEAK
jgi:hypothetical protein